MFRAKDTFWAPDNRRIVKGDLVAPHDPVLEGREGLFEEVVIPIAVAPAGKPPAAKTLAKKAAASKPAVSKDTGTATQDPADEKQADGGDEA
ncbi:hypothetical protein [Streptomyces sp. B21-083]|uniref:hypothetical protein n=1 Tax=Streptomyces sp. B21-083 TaxID=3039410 RepID=UPI002FF14DD3